MLHQLRRYATLGLWAEIVAYHDGHSDTGQEAQAIRALALAAQRNLGAAELQISQLLAQPDLPLNCTADIAATLLILGRLDEAEALLAQVLSADPDHGLANLRLGAWRLTQGQLTQALPHLQIGLAAYSDHVASRTALVGALMSQAAADDMASLAQYHIDQLSVSLVQLGAELPQDVLDTRIAWLREQQLSLWVLTHAQAVAEEWLTERAVRLPSEEAARLIVHYCRRLGNQLKLDEALSFLTEIIDAGKVESVQLLMEAAENNMALGRAREAVRMANRALRMASKQDKLTPIFWIKIAGYAQQQMPRRAALALRRAKKTLDAALLDPKTQEAARALEPALAMAEASALMEASKYAEVEEKLLGLLEKAPDFVSAWNMLGQVRSVLGNIDGAVAALEKLTELDPVRGHNALIQMKHMPNDPQLLERLSRMTRDPNLPPLLRASYMMNLGNAWEKLRDYDRAFALVSEGNKIIRHAIGYDAQKHRDQCARIRARFSKAFLQDRAGYGSDSDLPVFVVGMPRSGTTLVEQILGSHSRVHGAGELGLIPGITHSMNRWERRIGSGRSYPDCADDLTQTEVQAMASRLLAKLETMGNGAERVVDKLPHNFMNIGLIKMLFPKARIISVRRDPRDIAVSNFFIDFSAKHGGMGFAYDLADIGYELADHAQLMWHWNVVFPGEILEVNYEELVDDVEAQSRRIIDYIGLEWEPQVLNFNELDRPVRTASVMQVRKPIYGSSKQKWRRYEAYLQPLATAVSQPIPSLSVKGMINMKQPGLVGQAAAFLAAGDLDQAERLCRILLTGLPQHGAAQFLLGMVFARKGHPRDGLDLIEKALITCPQRRDWRSEALRLCAFLNDEGRANTLDPNGSLRRQAVASPTQGETV